MVAQMKISSHEQLLALIHYEPSTGEFTWRQGRNKGKLCGWVGDNGYRVISFGGHQRRVYSAARLAWFYVTGQWPEHDVDHCDRNPSNNRWNNFRLATRSQNLQNSVSRGGSSKFKGVSFDKSRRKWRAMIGAKRPIFLGRFATEEEAAKCYDEAALKLFGQFARVNLRSEASNGV